MNHKPKGWVMQVSSHAWTKRFGKPEKLSKKLSKKDKGEYWFHYVCGGFNKSQTFEQHIKWLMSFGHFWYVDNSKPNKKSIHLIK